MKDIEIDWSILERLRSRFLAGRAALGAYWESDSELRHYHATFAARIGWKWDHALSEISERGFLSRGRRLLDWGCGSGIASLRALDAWGAESFDQALVWDHSVLACRFAQSSLAAAHPDLASRIATSEDFEPEALNDTVVLISHALNELSPEQRISLAQQLRHALQVIIVEPGDYASSRLLIELRERLSNSFDIAAPCTRCGGCPMLEEANASHWCHFFAKPPIEAFTDGDWARFATMLQIDLRSLPYSFLALQRPNPGNDAAETIEPEASRLIGRPRFHKGYARVLSCDDLGLRELELQQRDHKGLWKSLKKGKDGTLYRWQAIEQDRIKSGHPL